ncbi:hypothetical protein [Carboxylicivirga marina]|uniref:hypothetical protein n=1 Tax=Carboxylicivirga marina TaxID=2800988 RepID=UPI0025915FB3|nr:hypothetical protein [uncultured Carboxylicivirga sp.]
MKNPIRFLKGESLIISILLLFFTTDALNVILVGLVDDLISYTSSYAKLSAVSKGLIILAYYMNALFQNAKRFVVITVVILVFLINAAIIYNSDGFNFYFTWMIRVAKLALPFILFDIIKKTYIRDYRSVLNIYIVLLLLQSLIVGVAFLFNLDLFLTYGHHRFGYSGVLTAQNEASFYYVIAVVFLLKHWQLAGRKIVVGLLFLVMLASILLGSKAVFIFYISFGIYIVLMQRGGYKYVVAIVVGSLGLASVLFLYIIGYFDFYINYWQEADFLTMVTSFRNLLIQDRLPEVFANWKLNNYLFGGINPATSFVEMDVIDLFTFGGLIGSLLYYGLLFNTLFKFSRKNYLGWFLVSQYFIIGGLAGHVFASGINAIYLALTCYYLQESEKKKELVTVQSID